MRIRIAGEQCGLKKHHASVPDARRAAKKGQDQPGKERLDEKEQKSADEKRAGVQTSRIGMMRKVDSHSNQPERQALRLNYRNHRKHFALQRAGSACYSQRFTAFGCRRTFCSPLAVPTQKRGPATGCSSRQQ